MMNTPEFLVPMWEIAMNGAGALALLWIIAPGALLLAAIAYERDGAMATRAEVEEGHDSRPRVGRKRALIVGAGIVGQTLARNLEAGAGYEVVGFADDQDALPIEMRESVLGSREDTIHLVRTFQIDEVFVAYAPSWQQRLAQELAAEQPEVRVQIVPTAYEALMRVDRVSSIGDVAVLRLNTDVGCLFDLFKRGVDILSALLGSIVLSPAALLVALLIRVTSRGPVIFAQERVGKGGRPFVLYKFRTMVHGAEAQTGPVLSNGRRDSRVTPVGRLLRATRLDELPQLWNVLLGDMSLVGPRPERPHFVRRFEREIPSYTQRHLVRPGITGLAQVHGNYHTDARDKLRFDLIYVSHRCLLLDLKVIARTVQVVLSSRGS